VPKLELLTLGIVLIATLLFVLPAREPTWDAAAYWGAGKFIWSGGGAGLWEPLRPPVLPVIFGLLWRIGVPPLVAFALVGVAASLVVYLCLFALGKRLGIGRSWVIALATLSPLLIWSAPRGLTEAPAIALGLVAILLLDQRRIVWAGMVAGLAFLTKFPMGLVILACVAALVFERRKGTLRSRLRERGMDAAWCLTAAAVPVIAYLMANVALYGNPFVPFVDGSSVIAASGVWLYQAGPLFYVMEALKENVLLVFALLGMVLALRQRTAGALATVSAALLLLVYCSVIEHKEIRFLVLFLPLFGLLAALGIDACARRWWFIVLPALLVLVQLGMTGVYWYHYDAPYVAVLHEADATLAAATGQVLVANPRPALVIDNRLALMYYPLYDENRYLSVARSVDRYGALMWSECDLDCGPSDARCRWARQRLVDALVGQETQGASLRSERQGDCVWRYVMR
jgi:hypothetical protein